MGNKRQKNKELEKDIENNEKGKVSENEISNKDTVLLEEIEQLKKELTETKDKWLRIAAEFENFRKRNISEKSNWIRNANERLILEMCDVVDNFERALMLKNDKENLESYDKGIELIYKQLTNLLTKEGVVKIEALEKDFDPKYHEALSQIPSEIEENKIAAIIQNGYIMNEKVIRPARVVVSNGEKPKNK